VNNRPDGLRWVGDNELAVVHQMEQYHSVRGPGFFWINPFTQTVRMVLSVEVPPALQNRFTAVVQRNVNVQDIGQYEPYELTQAMRTECGDMRAG
jgi:hypothetical protein